MKATLKWVALSATLAVCYVAGAGAQLGVGGSHPTKADMQQAIRQERGKEREARANRCIPQRVKRWTYVTQIPEPLLKGVLRWQQGETLRVRALKSRCLSSPRAIIIHVFGSRSAAALRVAECESHLYPHAVGAAGERGLFQIHPVHRSWLGSTWYRLFDPLVNARVAYGMSSLRRADGTRVPGTGGMDWSAWSCQP